jgi:hypothetical protein
VMAVVVVVVVVVVKAVLMVVIDWLETFPTWCDVLWRRLHASLLGGSGNIVVDCCGYESIGGHFYDFVSLKWCGWCTWRISGRVSFCWDDGEMWRKVWGGFLPLGWGTVAWMRRRQKFHDNFVNRSVSLLCSQFAITCRWRRHIVSTTV